MIRLLALCFLAATAFTAGATNLSGPSTSSGQFTLTWTAPYGLAMDSAYGEQIYALADSGVTSKAFDLPSGTYHFELYRCTQIPYIGHTECEYSNVKHSVEVTRPNSDSTIETSSSNLAVGTTNYVADVSNTGAATIAVPIRTPIGMHGVELPLVLAYDSTRHSRIESVEVIDDRVAYGWSLQGIPSSARCRTGVSGPMAMDSTDRLCINGSPLIAVSGSYFQTNTEYRTKNANFVKVVQRAIRIADLVRGLLS